MKFTVMGAGGVGGYFGARLAAAGHEVGFVARGRHLEAMRVHGLAVRSLLGDVELRPVRASDDPAALGAAIACCSRSSPTTAKPPPRRSGPLSGPIPSSSPC